MHACFTHTHTHTHTHAHANFLRPVHSDHWTIVPCQRAISLGAIVTVRGDSAVPNSCFDSHTLRDVPRTNFPAVRQKTIAKEEILKYLRLRLQIEGVKHMYIFSHTKPPWLRGTVALRLSRSTERRCCCGRISQDKDPRLKIPST